MTHKLSATDSETSDRANTEPKSELAQPHHSNTEQSLSTDVRKKVINALSRLQLNTFQMMELDEADIESKADEIMTLFATHTAEAVRAELSHCCDECGFWHTKHKGGVAMTFDERLAQLDNEKGDV